VADVFSVIRNVGVPRGITTPDKPNISSTIWRTVADQKQRVYYYESTFSPSAVWVNFADLDFGPASGVRKLQLHGDPDRAGNQTREFRLAEPFRFLRPKPEERTPAEPPMPHRRSLPAARRDMWHAIVLAGTVPPP
jgi:choloylglycine hydrolase